MLDRFDTEIAQTQAKLERLYKKRAPYAAELGADRARWRLTKLGWIVVVSIASSLLVASSAYITQLVT